MEVWFEERIVKRVQVKLTPDGEKRRAKMLAECRCLGCGEVFAKGEESKRGLHLRCYEAFRRAVRAGRATDREMVREGKMLSPNPGRPLSNPLARDLAGQ
jgi:hypothetical protein